MITQERETRVERAAQDHEQVDDDGEGEGQVLEEGLALRQVVEEQVVGEAVAVHHLLDETIVLVEKVLDLARLILSVAASRHTRQVSNTTHTRHTARHPARHTHDPQTHGQGAGTC